jgi:endonuclease/exonuclease/phosphatase family metal-dependent hydrolase
MTRRNLKAMFIFGALSLLACDRDGGSAGREQRPEPRAPAPQPEPGAGKERPGRAAHLLEPAAGDRAPSAVAEDSPWYSFGACERALGKRAARTAGSARIGTWNIRWFPDGFPGKQPRAVTDVYWASCIIAWIDVDVLAVQEFKSYPHAKERVSELLRRLETYTGDSWKIQIDDCDPGQHVGFIYNAKRVRAREFHDHAALNPFGSACARQFRPGLGGYFSFPGGLDLHMVAVHFDSGRAPVAIENRRKSAAGIATAFRDMQRSVSDPDVMVLGDFNTMGCSRCRPRVTLEQELEEFDRRLAELSAPMRRLPASARCSEYWRGKGYLLDHVLVSESMSEIGPNTVANVSGFCSDTKCRPLRKDEFPESYGKLSDHCPVVVEIQDRDQD